MDIPECYSYTRMIEVQWMIALTESSHSSPPLSFFTHSLACTYSLASVSGWKVTSLRESAQCESESRSKSHLFEGYCTIVKVKVKDISLRKAVVLRKWKSPVWEKAHNGVKFCLLWIGHCETRELGTGAQCLWVKLEFVRHLGNNCHSGKF